MTLGGLITSVLIQASTNPNLSFRIVGETRVKVNSGN